tara:strand:+ start:83 stop:199 length:117 start_codon:yes stop_codon:yes gene_type:complete
MGMVYRCNVRDIVKQSHSPAIAGLIILAVKSKRDYIWE